MAQSRGTVLLIDDDAFFLKVLADAFVGSGFSVITAGNGADGIRAFTEQRPQVVISDLIMPGMGGVSTCMAIARAAGEQRPLLILLTSMFKDAPHEHEAAEMGASMHIPKSTHPLNIVVIVEQLLDRPKYQPAAFS
jgi:two-component system, OmpR family, response regulator